MAKLSPAKLSPGEIPPPLYAVIPGFAGRALPSGEGHAATLCCFARSCWWLLCSGPRYSRIAGFWGSTPCAPGRYSPKGPASPAIIAPGKSRGEAGTATHQGPQYPAAAYPAPPSAAAGGRTAPHGHYVTVAPLHGAQLRPFPSKGGAAAQAPRRRLRVACNVQGGHFQGGRRLGGHCGGGARCRQRHIQALAQPQAQGHAHAQAEAQAPAQTTLLFVSVSFSTEDRGLGLRREVGAGGTRLLLLHSPLPDVWAREG